MRFRPLNMAGIIAVLPAALGVSCVVGRVNLSLLSLANVSLLFLICVVSALAGLFLSCWMPAKPLARSVQAAGGAWLAFCVWTGGAFVWRLADFVRHGAP